MVAAEEGLRKDLADRGISPIALVHVDKLLPLYLVLDRRRVVHGEHATPRLTTEGGMPRPLIEQNNVARLGLDRVGRYLSRR